MKSPQLFRCLNDFANNLENHYRCNVEWYQENCRIYLDEYPEQEKERAIYFCQDTWRSIMKRFTEKT